MISHKFSKMSLGIVLLLFATSCSSSDNSSPEGKITTETTEVLEAWSEQGKKEWVKQASGGDSSSDAWHECLINQAEKEYSSPMLWESDLEQMQARNGATEYLMKVFAYCNVQKDLGKLESTNPEAWSKADIEELRLGCLESEFRSGIFCACYVDSVSKTYPTKKEIVNDSGWERTIERLISSCESLEDGQNSNTNKPRPAEQTPNYPPCEMVLAPGQSGLTINDNRRELGRSDGQPGYCILPNSGGEKYYYPGR